MILINKNSEPHSWTERRMTPGASYEPTPDLRKALLDEQGYICAYCMRRISDNTPDTAGSMSKIEHILSQDNHEDKQMEYSNMVICCDGDIDGNGLHCDSSKGSKDLACSPLSPSAMATIKYHPSDGLIKSTNPIYDDEINNDFYVFTKSKSIRKSQCNCFHDTSFLFKDKSLSL